MKKYIALALSALVVTAIAQTGVEEVKEIETTTDAGVETIYVGAAYSTTEDTAPLFSAAKWKIKRIVTATNGNVSISYAYNPTKAGDWAMRSNVWTNRASTNTAVIIYKAGQ